jgi:hypothetical protein
MKKFKNLTMVLLLVIVTFMGCKAKDKEIILSNDAGGQLESQKKDVSESTELGNNYLKQGKYDKLGFSINFPDSWKGKYTVNESNEGIRVYFKPSSENTVGSGFLFGVLKKSDNLDESTFDTVSSKVRYFTAKGITYVVGGPTDVNFDENDPEFNVFLKMSKESAKVVETLKGL